MLAHGGSAGRQGALRGGGYWGVTVGPLGRLRDVGYGPLREFRPPPISRELTRLNT
jgi:hypothetical protein